MNLCSALSFVWFLSCFQGNHSLYSCDSSSPYALCLTLDLGPGINAHEPHPLAVWENSVYFNIYTPCNCMAGSMKLLLFFVGFLYIETMGVSHSAGFRVPERALRKKTGNGTCNLNSTPRFAQISGQNTGVPSLFCINQLGTQIKHPVSF